MIEKIKKLIISIGTFFLMLPLKVFGVDYSDLETFYGAQPVEDIDMKSKILANLLTVLRVLFIPIILLIGCVIYICKSKNYKHRKIAIIVLGIIITISIILLVNILI